jgi:hypothetical protein
MFKVQRFIVYFRAQGSKSEIPVIPPVSCTNTSEDISTSIQEDVVDSDTNETSTNIPLNTDDGTTEITAGSEASDECNETLRKNMNRIELTELVATELSSPLDSNETAPIPQCPSTDDTEDNVTAVTLEEDATERCPTGNYFYRE